MFVLDLPGWNSLPRMLQHSVSSSSFKTALKIYLLKNFPKLLPLSQSSLYSCHLKSFCVWLVLLPNTLWSHSVWKMGSFSSNYTDPQGEPPCPCASMCKVFFPDNILSTTQANFISCSHAESLWAFVVTQKVWTYVFEVKFTGMVQVFKNDCLLHIFWPVELFATKHGVSTSSWDWMLCKNSGLPSSITVKV